MVYSFAFLTWATILTRNRRPTQFIQNFSVDRLWWGLSEEHIKDSGIKVLGSSECVHNGSFRVMAFNSTLPQSAEAIPNPINKKIQIMGHN